MVIDTGKKGDIKIKKTEKTQLPPSKIVVRKLPPTFTEEDFINAIAPIPECNYFRFSNADRSLGSFAYSRAYLSFVNTDEIMIFRDKFDGYVFVDQKGNEFPAIVEYAPFQKIPKSSPNPKKDPRCGTVEEDPDYIAFLELLTNPETVVLPQIETLLEEIDIQEKELKANNGLLKIKTPLLEYVEQRGIDRLRSGEKRRRKEFDRKRMREEDKRRRKEIKEYRKKDERGAPASTASTSYRERQKRREEERQRILELREKEKKQRKAREYEKPIGKSYKNDNKFNVEENYAKPEKSFKSKRYSEARKRDDKKGESAEKEKLTKTEEEEEEIKDVVENKEVEEEQEICVKDEVDGIDDDNKDGEEGMEEDNKDGGEEDDEKDGKDPRTERRIRNKDRPTMQLYRPGQKRLNNSRPPKQNQDDGEEDPCCAIPDSSSSSPSPVQSSDQEKIKEDKKDTEESQLPDKEKERKDDKKDKDKGWIKDNYYNNSKSYNDKKGRYNKGVDKNYGRYKEREEEYEDNEDKSTEKGTRRGYSYHHERENKAKQKTKEQPVDSPQMKSMTFHRSGDNL